ncbi:hypothetical protein [Leptothermofonsia sp. ETS-13]
MQGISEVTKVTEVICDYDVAGTSEERYLYHSVGKTQSNATDAYGNRSRG